jgi:hypothetical protein
MAKLNPREWAKLAMEMRHNRIMRIFDDQQLMFLMAAWATDQVLDRSPSLAGLRLAA